MKRCSIKGLQQLGNRASNNSLVSTESEAINLSTEISTSINTFINYKRHSRYYYAIQSPWKEYGRQSSFSCYTNFREDCIRIGHTQCSQFIHNLQETVLRWGILNAVRTTISLLLRHKKFVEYGLRMGHTNCSHIWHSQNRSCAVLKVAPPAIR